tara:strand:- start:650 stop:2029 length:1380 start_codon:yes stop_codon:yes gene_type:complete
MGLMFTVDALPQGHATKRDVPNRALESRLRDEASTRIRSIQKSVGNWATWRGPKGTGEAPGGNPPTTWSEDKNIRWKVELPGLGSSTPVIWNDRIYLTTAIETEEEGKASSRASGGRGREREVPLTKVYDFRVLALDRKDGSVIWSKSVNKVVPHERGHRTSSQASASPVTDGQYIYAHFGSRGIHCLDLNGKIKWSKDFGQMRTCNGFGEGSSPALLDDKVVVVWDHEGDSFICALNKRSGRQLWRTARSEATSWGTPVIAKIGRRTQVIVAATRASRGYDLKNGSEIWSCTGMTKNVICTPVVQDDVAWLMSGLRGSMLQAVKLSGAKGDISDSKNLLWSHTRQTSYVPSPLLYDGRLWFLRVGHGVLSCLDAKSGEVFYEGQRLAGLKTIYSSPVAAAGRVYLTSREGRTMVIKASDKFEELATNRLDDTFDASAIILGKEIYLRGRRSLYCIAER